MSKLKLFAAGFAALVAVLAMNFALVSMGMQS